ncbi:MAG: hypothetical protein JWO04_5199 [Gammaproteobacteria bacterium]|jgi:hypothetical protein|nr:hypothetical protein [Gammaproteobacteria bacterium]
MPWARPSVDTFVDTLARATLERGASHCDAACRFNARRWVAAGCFHVSVDRP